MDRVWTTAVNGEEECKIEMEVEMKMGVSVIVREECVASYYVF